ncbi:class I adenylate-forming enzyme family protein [soil metagenome]
MADTVDSLLRRQSAVFGDKPMVVDPATRLTYRDLDRSTRALAAGLLQVGISKGTRVGIIMPNGADWVRLALALTRIGAVLVPLSTLLRPRELVAQLRTASVQHLIAVAEFRGHHYLAELRTELTAPQLGDGTSHDANLPALRRVWTPEQVLSHATVTAPERFIDALTEAARPSDPLAVMFTSGSSGAPKGVVHTHGNALGAVGSGLAARCITADTRLYLPMPFFWVGGFGAGVLAALLAGATLVTEPVSEPATTLALLQRERVTLFRGWPDQAETLARQADGADLSTLEPGSLAALLPPVLRAASGSRAKLFGMTESFGPYCGYPADTDMPRTAWGSCGKPFPGMQLRIVDTDTGEDVPAGTIGMIQLRGPHMMAGICRRRRDEVFTIDGYYPTGDLGHLDTDGFLFYHGRSDDMFKVSGATVYPSEVEQALRVIPGVHGAYATNVPGPEGDRVGAAVVCDTATCSPAALREAAKTLLSSFKVPTGWLLLDQDSAIPRGSTGKVDMPRLRALLADITPAERETR